MVNPNRKSRPAGVIAVAGMPRSGSTWQFNATRLLLEDANLKFWSGWIEDFESARGPIRLVKVHNPSDFERNAHLTLTTWRPFPECLHSLIRMGWVEPEKSAVQKAYHRQRLLYHHWAIRSDHETAHRRFVNNPKLEVSRIEKVLEKTFGIPENPGRVRRVTEKLSALRPPKAPKVEKGGAQKSYENRHDPETLLHPGHIGQEESVDLSQIKAWLDGQH